MSETKKTENGILEFRSLKTIPVRFLYPDWWDVQEGAGSETYFNALISGNHEESCVGQIVVQVFQLTEEPHDSPAEHIRQYSEKMRSAGYHLSGAPVLPCPPILGFDAGFIFNPIASYDGHQFDAPMLVFESSEYIVLLGLIGICQHESPEWWEVNKRVFELIRDSLRIGEQALEEKKPPQSTGDKSSRPKPKFPDAGLIQ